MVKYIYLADSKVSNVKPGYFQGIYEACRSDFPHIAAATSEFSGERGTLYFEGGDGHNHYGYAIRPDGELVFVFSTVRGMGDTLVADAVRRGANYLDCFDGHLVDLYGRHGFEVDHREANWTPGEPDVVHMIHDSRVY
jgi:outer membrane protein assembly factor BamB